jgi:hypothetical protein
VLVVDGRKSGIGEIFSVVEKSCSKRFENSVFGHEANSHVALDRLCPSIAFKRRVLTFEVNHSKRQSRARNVKS